MTTDASLLERWANRLQNATVSHLPTDYTRPSPPRLVEASVSRSIDPEVQLALFRLVLQATDGPQSTSRFTILLSAFIVLVQRLTGDEDISIATSSEGGDPFVLRCRVSPSESFADLLRQVKLVTAIHLLRRIQSLIERLKPKERQTLLDFTISLNISVNLSQIGTPKRSPLFSIYVSTIPRMPHLHTSLRPRT